ncbi:MAG: Na(+)-translocating NADH-quinone reductase subunit A [Flavobacteriales bacterium]
MAVRVKIRKGVDIKLKGVPDKVLSHELQTNEFAVKPSDFHGLIPKLIVKSGDRVKAGSVLFFNKYNERIKFTSPVSGTVTDIVRGEKRRIIEIRLAADKDQEYEEFKAGNPNELSRDEIVEKLLNAGLWPLIRQRPYSIIANPDDKPKSIFISAFDSNPLAADCDFIVHGNGELFQIGLDAVVKLTEGKVHLNVKAGGAASKVFLNSKGVVINEMAGPHPAGNVGVQIHHIDPINQNERVWYLMPQDVLTIGRLFKQGKFNAERIVALGGPSVLKPRYYHLKIGASVKGLIDGNVEGDNNRIISGSVLTGMQISPDGYIGFYDSQVTVIPEGDKEEFFGWLNPGFKKFSLSRTFCSWLTPGKEYTLDTNLHGEDRAFVMSGEYEKVFPFDIYPTQLVKAIMIGDIELMENLGIYEVAPEDFALCEFACTSKINLQDIVRKGLDIVHKECG